MAEVERTRGGRRHGGPDPDPQLAEGPSARPGGESPPRRPPREILVTFQDDEPRVAIFEGGALVEVDFDPRQGRRIVGNVYRGRVQNVLPGMQAAFVDIGLERNAFLFVDDAHPSGRLDPAWEVGAEAGPPPAADVSITALVRPGQELLVQVVKEPVGNKGARVTRALTLPGRYLVLMAGVDYVGVSRRIRGEGERDRLRAVGERVRDAGVGLIVRTAAEGVPDEALAADWNVLRSLWRQIGERYRAARAPALVYRDGDVVQRMVRDQLSGEVAAIVIDRADESERMRALIAALAPGYTACLRLAQPDEVREGLFAARGVDTEVERALGRHVSLRSGAYLVIDQTEALTAVDVNTGRFVGGPGGSLDDTFLRANLEAAHEIARQLRLRDVGGIIVVDFIDMELPEHRRQVLDELQAACEPDHSRPQVLGITQLGLVEMTRKKARQSLRELLTKVCPSCEGHGRLLSEEAISLRVRRQIRAALLGSDAEAVLVEVHPSIAAILIGQGGESLRALEHSLGRSVFVRGSTDSQLEGFRVACLGSRREVEAQARPVREGQVLELRVEEPHANSRADGIARVEGYVVDIAEGAERVGQRVRVEIVKTFRTYAKARMV